MSETDVVYSALLLALPANVRYMVMFLRAAWSLVRKDKRPR